MKICVSGRWVTLWVRPPDIVAKQRSDYCPCGAIFFLLADIFALFIAQAQAINNLLAALKNIGMVPFQTHLAILEPSIGHFGVWRH